MKRDGSEAIGAALTTLLQLVATLYPTDTTRPGVVLSDLDGYVPRKSFDPTRESSIPIKRYYAAIARYRDTNMGVKKRVVAKGYGDTLVEAVSELIGGLVMPRDLFAELAERQAQLLEARPLRLGPSMRKLGERFAARTPVKAKRPRRKRSQPKLKRASLEHAILATVAARGRGAHVRALVAKARRS